MRKGGKGETGESSYILIIPVVFGWWHRECVCVCVCVCLMGELPPCSPTPKGESGTEEQSWRASMQSPAILSRAEFSWARPGASRGLHFPFQLLCHSHEDLQSERIMGNAGVKHMNLISFIRAYKLAMLTLGQHNQCSILLYKVEMCCNNDSLVLDLLNTNFAASIPLPIILTHLLRSREIR